MYWFLWIFVGFVAGWLTGRSLEGEGYGRFMDIAMGIGGAVVGGFLTHTVGLSGRRRSDSRELSSQGWRDSVPDGSRAPTGRRVYARQP